MGRPSGSSDSKWFGAGLFSTTTTTTTILRLQMEETTTKTNVQGQIHLFLDLFLSPISVELEDKSDFVLWLDVRRVWRRPKEALAPRILYSGSKRIFPINFQERKRKTKTKMSRKTKKKRMKNQKKEKKEIDKIFFFISNLKHGWRYCLKLRVVYIKYRSLYIYSIYIYNHTHIVYT